jgi:hypothetical protein
MGGKRPDQYQIDPSEGGATDYKNLPQTGRGHSDALDTPEDDKLKLSREQQEAKGQPFLPDVPAPSVHARQGRTLNAEEIEAELHGQGGAKDVQDRKEDPLV